MAFAFIKVPLSGPTTIYKCIRFWAVMVSKDERKRFREMQKTLKDVFDLFSEQNLFRLIKQGYFDGLESPLSIGKEANVFSALRQDERVAVKIYRLQTCDFNRMYEYIKADPRFPHVKHGKRNIVFAWTQREYRNLLKAREVGVRCPSPFTFLKNILVMEYIGDEEGPAPRLDSLPPKDPDSFFSAVVENMEKLCRIGMVHGDLSHFNILNHDERPVFIDMSQATTVDNPYFEQYLARDVKNVCNYFRKLGVRADAEEIVERLQQHLKESRTA